jgi:hypothetical protein
VTFAGQQLPHLPSPGKGGVGLNLGSSTIQELSKRIPKWPIKAELEHEWMGTVRDAQAVRPDVALCRGGS